MIYRNEEGGEEEYINIYSGIKIIITTMKTFDRDRYKKLPTTIEYLVIDNMIYDTREEEEMIIFISEDRLIENINKKIKEGMIDDSNKNGETVLMAVCIKEMKEEALEIIELMSERGINSKNKNNETALLTSEEAIFLIKKLWACYNRMDEVILELIKRMSGERIDEYDVYGMTGLQWLCRSNMEYKIVKEMIERMSNRAINKWDRDGYTALFWSCYNDMEEVALELIVRMNEDAINKMNKDGETSLLTSKEAIF